MKSPHLICCLLLIACLAAPVVAQDDADQPDAELSPQQEQIQQLQQQAELRQLQSQLHQHDQQEAMLETTDETARLQAETALMTARQQKALADLQAQKQRLTLDYELMQQKQQLELAETQMETEQLTAEAAQLAAEAALTEARANKALALLRQQAAQLEAENALATARFQQQTLARQDQTAELQAEIAMLQFQQQQLVLEHEIAMQEMLGEQARAQATMDTLALQLELRGQTESWRDQTNQEVPYPIDPVIDGSLHISDRRIELDLLIMPGTGAYISDRINFFNNQSTERPIFLVINECLGGSVMEGWQIIQSIESSEAPVYVVVKSMAASMAAIITSQAEHSYAFPNAVILHHEIRSVSSGSTTEVQEELEEMKLWERRTLGPIAAKMGITVEEFRRLMYEHNSDGDWEEFTEAAMDLGWVNNMVQEIREEGIIKRPEGTPEPLWGLLFDFGQDTNGNEYVLLPRLNPCDFYFIYNPDNYYRLH